ncbi:N-acetyltransferase [Ensifer adhaerens]|uniref:GNAT family N-acetyltransferase n=1 Tax=Ensifer adhaerens TaxID=106592 RepID=UPI001CBD0D4F|nr:N-acetyltransferase [Ensifer adhaerens]MBZ7922191.1 N-acetyltransferase [Ensifer adhaerens]UAX94671.1 N-acetyltransferase [Ensifer adhaerens]UAY02309.1 N-acetyltransferase [Ensifer adhaerens]UAY09690.1 N-acetyltransferase [Ensifer adhaerens]
MEIRSERTKDIAAVRAITKAAFAPMAYSSQTEAEIIDALRVAGALTISLVAVADDDVVGHVAFSAVTIDGEDKGWYALGPVSVRPDRQNGGIGGRLIREGLARLAKTGAKGCVLLGDPAYYKRFGFETHTALRLEGVPAEYFMAQAFEGPVPSGRVSHHEGFDAS